VSEISVTIRSSVTVAAPVRRDERIESLDVMRGVALLGILLMNIIAFGMPMATYYNPSVMGVDNPANLWSYIINWLFFEGTMRAIFSMLFGAGMVLMTTRAEERGAGIEAADIYYRRIMWLILFGVIDAYLLLWAGDILYLYGIAGLFLFVFRHTAPRTLFAIGLAMLVFMGIKQVNYNSELTHLREVMTEVQAVQAAGGTLTDEQQAAVAHMEALKAEYEPDPAQIQQDIAIRRSDWLTQVEYLAPINVMFQSKFTYLLAIWDVLMMMFFGMALIKWKVFDATRSWGFYGAMVVLGYGIGLPVNWYEIRMAIDSNFALEWTGMEFVSTYQIGRAGTAAGHIGLVMLICKSGLFRFLTAPLAAVGRMALTNYLSHSIICLFLFTGVGLSWYGALERYQLYYVVAGIWAFQLVLSPIWLNYFRFGPMEWLWRSLTYGRVQPMRRQLVAAAEL
jgi:uncharacterized protein